MHFGIWLEGSGDEIALETDRDDVFGPAGEVLFAFPVGILKGDLLADEAGGFETGFDEFEFGGELCDLGFDLHSAGYIGGDLLRCYDDG
jgi:hypothetical protein